MKGLRVRSLVFVTVAGDVMLFILSYWLLLNTPINALWNIETIRVGVSSFMPIAGASILSLMVAYDMYKNIFYRTKTDIIASIIIIVTMSSIISVLVSYFFNTYFFPRSILIYAGLIQIVTLSIWRMMIWHLRKSMHVKQRILVIGYMEDAKDITQKILEHQGHIFNIQFIYDITKGVEGVYDLIFSVDHVLLGGNLNNEDAHNISTFCMKNHKNVFLIPGPYSINLNKASFIQIDDIPMFNLSTFGLSIEQQFVKRVFDLTVSSIALLFLLPLMLTIMAIMKMKDPGPIFFKQERITEGDKKFNVLKFRTMVVDAEKMTGPVLATDKDPRITPIGNFMRSTRIDELPQLINVLNGTMSLIGPRPEREFFIEKFLEETPEFGYRTAVKAGVTGLAQVFGKYTTSFEDKLRYDLMYIKNYSFILDMKIILKTVKVVLSKETSVGGRVEESFEAFLERKHLQLLYKEYGCRILEVRSKERPDERSDVKGIAS